MENFDNPDLKENFSPPAVLSNIASVKSCRGSIIGSNNLPILSNAQLIAIPVHYYRNGNAEVEQVERELKDKSLRGCSRKKKQ